MQNDHDDGAAEIDPLARMKSPSDFAGQQIFIQGEDWHNNAMLGWTLFPWDIYAAGYKDAADALVVALAERKASQAGSAIIAMRWRSQFNAISHQN